MAVWLPATRWIYFGELAFAAAFPPCHREPVLVLRQCAGEPTTLVVACETAPALMSSCTSGRRAIKPGAASVFIIISIRLYVS